MADDSATTELAAEAKEASFSVCSRSRRSAAAGTEDRRA